MFPCGFGAKSNRGMTCNGIFGLGRAKNETNGHFSRGLWRSLTLIPRSLLWNRTETRAWYACFSSAPRNGRFLSLPVAGSVSPNVATTGSGERRGCILLQGIHFSQPSKHIAACYRRCGDGAKRCDPKKQQNLPPYLFNFPRLLTSGRIPLFKRLQLEQATKQIQTWT